MLNVGFIGAGGIARHHAIRMVELRNARIRAVADILPASAASFAADFGAPHHFTDYRDLLKLDELDAVWVCTPTFQHAAPVVAAARAGKHVFCEKPIALNLRDAARMADACARSGVKLTVGFVRRFDTEWGQLMKIVASGAVGRPVIWRFVADGRPENPWFRDVTKGGGPLMDGAVHNYDFALQMFGAVESVQASSLQFDSSSVGADTASAVINFRSSDQHTLIWTWGLPFGARSAGLNDIVGPGGSVQFGMTASTPPRNFDPHRQGAFTLQTAHGKSRVYSFAKRDMFVAQLKHVVRCFERDEQPLVTGDDGIVALRVALAILKSGASHKTVRL